MKTEKEIRKEFEAHKERYNEAKKFKATSTLSGIRIKWELMLLEWVLS